ncbi:cytochrome P450 [Coniophora puteana RWD-64-598 SS2]|uniref:Cytochrome P450 n=1 Tax=Coniophora puteana (strain RWD-64-598) TaxID=741705 RepID=A0A5M3N576_CONPW|nr:cytochrome P450 [Coniophora puteana RWD-64-598 SS2]EIW86005.1 cytochrome P450 [Coniophora puteana RWD-64-598 SS2]
MAAKLLHSLLCTPEEFEEHIELFSASIILSTVYGCDVASKDDPLFITVKRANAAVMTYSTPLILGVIDALPWLPRFPHWLPDGGMKEIIAFVTASAQDLVHAPLRHFSQSKDIDNPRESMVGDFYQMRSEKEIPSTTEVAMKWAAATAFAAGTDTTFSTIVCFIYAMILHPDVQRRAQAQLDPVVGHERPPTLDDRKGLPLIDAILREVIRWIPVVPTNLPHAVSENDIYEGYFIPKGANVIVNIWAIFRDEKRYPDPEAFNPDRFLTSDGALTNDMSYMTVFGFGRRICPGRHLAETSIWVAMANMLAAFTFETLENVNGKSWEEDIKWTWGITARPTGFKCTITPRFHGVW